MAVTNSVSWPGLGVEGLRAEVAGFTGSTEQFRSGTGVTAGGGPGRISAGASAWEVTASVQPLPDRRDAWTWTVDFTVISGSLDQANVAVSLAMTRWSPSAYVLMPGAAYAGNRFRAAAQPYPPFLHDGDGIGPAMPLTITDVPRLAVEPGPSAIHLTAGDMTTPCIGIHAPSSGDSMLLFADLDPATGFRLEESADRGRAVLRVEWPVVRPSMYLHCRTGVPSPDRGRPFAAGDTARIRLVLHLFPCVTVGGLFARFLQCRDRQDAPGAAPAVLPFSAAFDTIESKYNTENWEPDQRYYTVGTDTSVIYGNWQAGWVGGGMTPLPFLASGTPLSRDRSRQTMDTVFGRLQAPNGWVYPVSAHGRLYGDDFSSVENHNVLLVRKDADVLLFAARLVLLLQQRGEEVPAAWLAGLGRLADAFVRLWEKHGQLGQFIDIATDRILQGGTASAGTAPGALALAGRVLGRPAYVTTAVAAARHLSEHTVRVGITAGGPGEALQCPDSESAFGLLESFVVLLEETGDPAWRDAAEECAAICASWCVSYDYRFPEASTFGRLGMRTTGCVWANVQNKHAAPGICTLSAASLLRLYRATGSERYLRLARQVARALPQFLSRADRPVTDPSGRALPAGWMNERVNMSDWETKDRVGEVFYGSCWSEVSCLLTFTEIPGVWLFTDTGTAVAFDHVEAEVTVDGAAGGGSWRLEVRNPTGFDARVKVLAEPRAGFARPWGDHPLEGCVVLAVPAGGSVEIRVPRA